MNRFFSRLGLLPVLTTGRWDGLHLQRLVERWLRRWGYALTGLALGLCGMWLARPEVSEAHASAVQAAARLAQQLADTPTGVPAPPSEKGLTASDKSVADALRLWGELPAGSQPEHVWTTWQQALAAHGLKLQFLQPMPPSASEGRNGALVSHVASWRVLGRFEDWARVWAACAESGPACAIERIQVVATDTPAEVQIDAVTRVWMRHSENLAADGADQGAAHLPLEEAQSDWMANVRTGFQPARPSRVALFAPNHGTASAEAGAGRGSADGVTPSTNPESASVAAASLVVLTDDPRQWPLAQVRLAGLWQQAGERQAVLSAGPHAVRVVHGQRVTLEGHRVVAITDAGVDLRLGTGPLLELPWVGGLQVGAAAGP